MSTTTLLVADENDDRARSLCTRIKSEHWSASTASTIPAAAGALDASPISLLLADAALWHAGLGAIVVERHPSLPVIVLTAGEETAGALVQHLKLGAMTYVPRDSSPRRLVETIQSILDLARRNPYRERIKTFLRAAEIDLQLGNDPGTVAAVVGYLQRILEDYGLSSERECFRVGIALSEAISNAMIHGNLEIPSDARNAGSDDYYEQIDRRRSAEPYASRHVQVHFRFSQSAATFVIRDQGNGFDPASLPDPSDPKNLIKASGRGIVLMKAYSDLVSWNETGNEVTLVKGLTA